MERAQRAERGCAGAGAGGAGAGGEVGGVGGVVGVVGVVGVGGVDERLLRKWVRREPMTQVEVAAMMGVSKQRVQQIEAGALAKIEAVLRARGWGAE